jgi:hypothetical protein
MLIPPPPKYRRPAIVDRSKSILRPPPNGILVDLQRRRQLLDGVGAVDFDPARIGVPGAHRYAAPLSINS